MEELKQQIIDMLDKVDDQSILHRILFMLLKAYSRNAGD